MATQILSYLLLSAPASKLAEVQRDDSLEEVLKPVEHILQGRSSELIKGNEYDKILYSDESRAILTQYPTQDLYTVMKKYIVHIHQSLQGSSDLPDFHLQILGIAFLQSFIQVNFTGPGISFDQDELFPGIDKAVIQNDALKLLAVEGQTAYDLTISPIFLLISSLIFEYLMGDSLIGAPIDITEATNKMLKYVEDHKAEPLSASLFWWRTRLLQIHQSLFSEITSFVPTLSTLLLVPEIVNALSNDTSMEVKQNLQAIFFIEASRISIHSQTENLALPYLSKARSISNFDIVLTGARGKRTKFQNFHTSNLIVLAKSNSKNFYEGIKEYDDPETHELNSDVLLERPQFEQLEDLEMPDRPDTKRIKFNPSGDEGDDGTEKLLPIALRREDIPVALKELDPNNQPPLNDLDNIQLLLRLTALRQSTPSGNALVEEELLAMVSRILFVDAKNVNWSVFSRGLWERSLLETNKAKTIERGILQMTSLIEEIGIKIKTRLIPQAKEEDEADGSTPVASRLRFIHQLTAMPQWSMDTKLAEKYMSIGVLRSALEIYERLQMACEAALCHAAVDNEPEAERILLERIQNHPEDARAISILGDIRQDPNLWLKAWEIGKYHKAKASLSQYYYAPPKDTGLSKNLALAIQHMNDALQINPLNYENWFFYGCCGLEAQQFDLAAEAFTRCVVLDDMNSHAWSNLATALLRSGKVRESFNALKKALRSANEGKRSWRIYENYLTVAMQLNEWNDVLIATRELLDIRGQSDGDAAIDIPVIEKLVEILVSSDFPTGENARLTHFQSSCIDLVCNIIPKVINNSDRCWRIVARVELWRKKPWDALECHEKAYRAISNNPELDYNEAIWNQAVEACIEVCAAYESLGELPGKHDAGDLVCKEWKFKARSTIRSLMSKGKNMWEDSEGWSRLQESKAEFST